MFLREEPRTEEGTSGEYEIEIDVGFKLTNNLVIDWPLLNDNLLAIGTSLDFHVAAALALYVADFFLQKQLKVIFLINCFVFELLVVSKLWQQPATVNL